MSSMPSQQEAIWRIAKVCACRRREKKCKEQFDSLACEECKWFILNYVDCDIRQAKLLMINAEGAAHETCEAIKTGDRVLTGFAIAFLVFLTIAVLTYKLYREGAGSPGEHEIRDTLKAVEKDLSNEIDYNGDGKINCVDASASFYKHFPNKSKIRLYWNYNTKQGMNHLFPLVEVDGEWIGVEAQAKHNREYRITEIWGNRYDPAFNSDATGRYSVFAK